jgi:Ca-activated chloride channel homolog
MGPHLTRTVAALAAVALTMTACSTGDAEVDDLAMADTDDAGPADGSVAATDGQRATTQDLEVAEDAPADADADPAEAGIAPPDDDQPGGIETVVFDDHGVSGWIDTSAQPESTFQTDADVASFRIAESWLTSGILPPAEGIRAEEWINVLDHDHPAPDSADVWQVTADAGAPWWETGPDAPATTRLLRVGLRAADPGPATTSEHSISRNGVESAFAPSVRMRLLFTSLESEPTASLCTKMCPRNTVRLRPWSAPL